MKRYLTMTSQVKIKQFLTEKKELVESALSNLVPSITAPFEKHLESFHYSLFAGGKRIRPILCLAAGEIISNAPETEKKLLPVACALECIHTYSLIHDDLPAMDNDSLRRGRPTNHVVYGEAEAILAGDGLLTWAFDLLSNQESIVADPARQLRIINIIARAAGTLGMVGGQALDIENENKSYPFELLQTIHKNKTGALITASIVSGAVAAGASSEQEKLLEKFGDRIGLAFQIADDLLDATSTTEKLGKTAGADQMNGKATYPDYFGIEKTREMVENVVSDAKQAIETFGKKADILMELADYIYARSY